MADEKTSETQTGSDSVDQQNQSPDGGQREEYLKPWLRQLGAAYAKNETLGKYDKLTDAVDDLLKRPEPKAVPDAYGLREGTDEVFKKAGLTAEEAKEVDSFYEKLLPKKQPDLKEHFKDGYDKTMADYGKGVGSISDDLKTQIKNEGLDKNPVFVEIMARVGSQIGEKSFNPPKEQPKAKGKENFAMNAVRKAYENYYGK